VGYLPLFPAAAPGAYAWLTPESSRSPSPGLPGGKERVVRVIQSKYSCWGWGCQAPSAGSGGRNWGTVQGASGEGIGWGGENRTGAEASLASGEQRVASGKIGEWRMANSEWRMALPLPLGEGWGKGRHWRMANSEWQEQRAASSEWRAVGSANGE
jgi:hypothetical protein